MLAEYEANQEIGRERVIFFLNSWADMFILMVKYPSVLNSGFWVGFLNIQQTSDLYWKENKRERVLTF